MPNRERAHSAAAALPAVPPPSPDLIAAVRAGAERGAVWRHESADLDVNVVAFGPGEGVAEHVNAEVDVLVVGLSGSGTVEVDGRDHPLTPGALVLIPKGARRSTRAGTDHVVYATCHRRRARLTPSPLGESAPYR